MAADADMSWPEARSISQPMCLSSFAGSLAPGWWATALPGASSPPSLALSPGPAWVSAWGWGLCRWERFGRVRPCAGETQGKGSWRREVPTPQRLPCSWRGRTVSAWPERPDPVLGAAVGAPILSSDVATGIFPEPFPAPGYQTPCRRGCWSSFPVKAAVVTASLAAAREMKVMNEQRGMWAVRGKGSSVYEWITRDWRCLK